MNILGLEEKGIRDFSIGSGTTRSPGPVHTLKGGVVCSRFLFN